MKKQKAFTLAEVLITLAIIGIVAAVTIPSVIANYQQQEFKTGLRKAVSVLNEAIQTNIVQEGESPYSRSDGWHTGRLDKYLSKHMNVIKSVNGQVVGPGTKNHAFYTTDGMRFEVAPQSGDLRSSNIVLHESGINIGDDIGFRANYGDFDGISWQSVKPCGSFGLAKNPHNIKIPPCFIIVDVNGDKKPTAYDSNTALNSKNGLIKQNYVYPEVNNKRVTDIFPILITEDRAIPFGVVAQRAMYEK